MFSSDSPYFERCTATCVVKGTAQPLSKVVIDSRKADATTAFLALPGETVDGNEFVQSALAAGAPAVIMTKKPTAEQRKAAEQAHAFLYVVQDGKAFLQELARAYRAELNALVIGVTGSVGKTTTKEMVKAVCETTFRTHATQGNHNNDLGLPLTILSAPEDCEILILEMGMNALYEIEKLASIGRPHVGIITNVGLSHIGMLGSRENIARAKSELLSGLIPPSSKLSEYFHIHGRPLALLHDSDDFTPWMVENVVDPRNMQLMTFGTRSESSVHATDISVNKEGLTRFTVHLHPSVANTVECEDAQVEEQLEHTYEVTLGIPGVHNVPNALAALCVATYLSIDGEVAAQALHNMHATSGRSLVVEAPRGYRIIDDTYNASPASMKAGLDMLSLMESLGRKIAVLGDMGELGEDEAALHAQVGAYLAKKNVDYLVTVGPLSQHIANEAHTNGMPASSIMTCGSVAEAIDALLHTIQLKAGDVVLVKASRSTGLERVVKGIVDN